MSKFVSVTELPTRFHDPVENIVSNGLVEVPATWDLVLPPNVDAERIVINGSRLRAMQRVGAICTTHVGEYQGEVTSYTPGVSGINADGTAVASKAGFANPAEPSKSRVWDHNYIEPHTLGTVGHAHIDIGINKAEAASRIVDKVREGQTREKAWASELDQTIRRTLRQSGRNHLIERTTRVRRYLDYLTFIVFTPLAVSQLETGANPWLIEGWLGLQSLTLFADSALNKINCGDMLLRERRWTLMLDNFQPERYVAFNALTRLPGLIKVRK